MKAQRNKDRGANEQTACGFSSLTAPVVLVPATHESERGFGIAPILYMLMLMGVGAGVLFSGYSQILQTNVRISNTVAAKNDVSATTSVLTSSAVFGTDGSTFCPPRSSHSLQTVCDDAVVKMVEFADVIAADAAKLPSNYSVAGAVAGNFETGVFAAGSGIKQLDPWGHFYVYCRWENSRSTGTNPAVAIISAGADGILQTSCSYGQTNGKALNDDVMTYLDVGAAINRSSLWQSTGTSFVAYGSTGSQVVVGADGSVQAQSLSVASTATIDELIISGTSSTLTVKGTTTLTALGVTGASSLSTLTVSGASTLGSLSVSGVSSLASLSVSGVSSLASLSVSGASSSGSLTVSGASTLGTLDVTGASNLASLNVSGASTLSALTVSGASTLSSLTVSGTAGLNNLTLGTPLAISSGGTGATTADSALSNFGGTGLGKGLFTVVNVASAWSLLGLTGSGTISVNTSGSAGSVAASGITGVLSLSQGGTGYAAASALDLLGYLGGRNASNLSTGTVSIALIADNSIPSTKLTTTGVTASTYNWGTVDAEGRVTAATNVANVQTVLNGQSAIDLDGSNNIFFITASNPQMTITATGSVGIGTTAPYQKLQVNAGNVRISNTAGTSRELQFSTGVNSMRWAVTANASAEGGGNAGSDFSVARYNDSGVYVDSPLVIARSTGAATFASALSAVSGAFSGSLTAATGSFTTGLTAATATVTGASTVGSQNVVGGLTAATATVSGLLTAGSANINGGIVATSATISGTLTAGTIVGALSGTTYLGVSTASTSPRRTDDATTGLFSATASVISAAIGGIDMFDVTSTAVNAAKQFAINNVPALRLTASGNPIVGLTGMSATASASVAVGYHALNVFSSSSTVAVNTAVGSEALALTTTGPNEAVGYQALANNTAGVYNSALGTRALYNNTTGAANVGVGFIAVAANTTGNENTGVGAQALQSNQAGSDNSAFGNYALYSTTTGPNDAFGAYAMALTTTGVGNAAFGYGTMNANVTGSWNSAYGYAALNKNTTGSNNAAFGRLSLTNNTTGSLNAALGDKAGYKLLTGSSNLILGPNVGSTTLASGSNNILIGTSASVDTPLAATNNFLNIGNTIYGNTASGWVGIGTNTPRASLDIGSKTDALLLPSGATGAVAAPVVGMIRYNTTNGTFEGYAGTTPTWGAISSSASVGSVIMLGTNSSTPSPYSASATNTGLYSNTATNVSVAIGGVEKFRVDSNGIQNSATATALSNAAFGAGALGVNTSGVYNTAIGMNTLKANTTGNYNTALGTTALYSNLSGVQNTAVGEQAMMSNVGGTQNAGFGDNALAYNVSGSGNTASGSGALAFASGGSYNTAIGMYAMRSATPNNLTGNNNTAVGNNSLYALMTTASGNAALGSDSGSKITTGSANTVIGNAVGSVKLTTGSHNILIGTSASVDTPAIGTNNFLNIGNTIYGDTASGFVGIGTTSPTSALEIANGGNLKMSGGTVAGQGNIQFTADANSYYDTNLVYMDSSAKTMGFIGGATPAFNNAYGPYMAFRGNTYTAIPSQRGIVSLAAGNPETPTTGEGQVQFYTGASILRMVVDANGFVGIGSTSPRASLDMSGKTDALLLPSGATGAVTTPVVGMIRYNTTSGTFEGYAGLTPTWGAISSTASVGSAIMLGTNTASPSPYSASATNTGLYSNTATNVSVAIGGVERFRVDSNGLQNSATATALYNAGFGAGAIAANTTGTYNAALGYTALTHNTIGTRNVALGFEALAANTTGSYNTAVGVDALAFNLAGYYNTANGFAALYNATGSGSTAVGHQAGKTITTGAQNTVLGFSVGSTKLTTGSNNILIGTSASTDTVAASTANGIAIGGRAGSYDTAVGVGALNSETTDGLYNTAFGYNALTADTSGNRNAAFGPESMYANTTGAFNTAVGSRALFSNITGSYNSANGGYALYTNTAGGLNVANGYYALFAATGTGGTGVGYAAGRSITTGTQNTVLGYAVGSTTLTTGSNNILIGTSASVDTPAAATSNFLNIGNTIYGNTVSGLVGIGTTVPVTLLHVSATANAGQLIESRTTTGIAYLQLSNTATGGIWNVEMGRSGANNSLGFYSNVAGSVMTLTSSVYVGIGSTVPRASLDLSGKTDALLLPQSASATTSIATPVVGMIRYNTTTNGFEGYAGSSPSWGAIGGGGSNTLGISTASISPYSASATNTGLFSATATSVSTAVSGVEMMRVTSTGVGIGGVTTPTVQMDVLGVVAANWYSSSAMGWPNLVARKGRGTLAAPTAVLSGDGLGNFGFQGYTGSAWSAPGGSLPGMNAIASENFSASANGTELTFWTVQNGTIAALERMRISNAGNVGIGTTAPTAPLHIYGGSTTDTFMTFGVGSSGANGLNAGYSGATYGAGTSFLNAHSLSGSSGALYFLTDATPRMVIGSTGNVGIGTTSPAATLDVNGTGIRIGAGGTGGAGVLWNNAGTLTWGATGISVSGSVTATGSPNYLTYFSTATLISPSVVYQAGSNIGVGTLVPGSMMQVGGNMAIGYTASVAAPANGLLVSGLVGIGTTTPNAPLLVLASNATTNTPGALTSYGGINLTNGSDSTLALRALGSGQVQLATDAVGRYMSFATDAFVERMRIASGGNIGIGTTTPVGLLDVYSATSASHTLLATATSIGIGSTTPRSSLDLSAKTDALLLPRSASATASIATPVVGMIRYNTAMNNFEGYSGSSPSWSTLGGGSNILGNSTASVSPYSSSATNTGLLSATATSVSVVIGGIEKFNVTSTAVTNGSAATALYNTGFGASVLSLATGTANTGFGFQSLAANTSGSYNTANGFQSLVTNTTGTKNSAYGFASLFVNTTGGNNTANGVYAMYYNSTGSLNVASGVSALFANVAGSGNTAIGANALTNATGTGGTALGYQAGKAITTGAQNLVLGNNVGSSTLTTGSNNILIGTSAAVDTPLASTSNFLNIGNTIYGDTASGYVGIGTTSPGFPLQVSGVNSVARIVGNHGDYIDFLFDAAGANPNINISRLSTEQASTLSFQTGTSADWTLKTSFTASPTLTMSSSSGVVMTYAQNGNVGIGTTAPAGLLDVYSATSASHALVAGANGFVGIGTTSPYSVLDVHQTGPGANGLTLSQPSTGYAPFLTWKTADATNALYSVRYGGGSGGALYFGLGDSSSYTAQVVFTAAGSVGIGSSTPRASLDLSAKSDALLLPRSASATTSVTTPVAGMLRYNTATNNFEGYSGSSPSWAAIGGALNVLGNSTASVSPYSSSAANTGFYSASATSVSTAVGGVEAMRVTANGVGIGTSSISAGLDVFGATTGVGQGAQGAMLAQVRDGMARPAVAVYGGIDGTALADTASTALAVRQVTGTGRSITTAGSIAVGGSAGTANSYLMGNVGIGTTTPGAKLEVSAGAVTAVRISDTYSGGKSWDLQSGIASVSESSFGIKNSTDGVQAVTITNTGNVGIGTTSPAASLDVNGTGIRIGAGGSGGAGVLWNNDGTLTWGATGISVSGSVTASGSPNYLTYFSTATTIGPSAMYQAGSNIGVGTVVPGSMMQVGGNMAIGYTASVAAPASGLIVNGKVGVGTTSPAYMLDVSGTIHAAGLVLGSGTASIDVILGTSAASTVPHVVGDATTGLFSAAASSVSVAANGVEKMRVTPTGLGIGTTAPGAALDVYANQAAGTQIKINNADTTDLGAFSSLTLYQGSTMRAAITSINDGYITGAGGGPAAMQVWNYANGNMVFGTNNTERLRITASGAVGIGSNSPRASLDLSAKTDALLLPSGATGAVTTPVAGMIRYNTTSAMFEGYSGTTLAWNQLGNSSATAGSGVMLGVSSATPSPYSASAANTGLFSNSATSVSVTIGGVDIADVTSSGLAVSGVVSVVPATSASSVTGLTVGAALSTGGSAYGLYLATASAAVDAYGIYSGPVYSGGSASGLVLGTASAMTTAYGVNIGSMFGKTGVSGIKMGSAISTTGAAYGVNANSIISSSGAAHGLSVNSIISTSGAASGIDMNSVISTSGDAAGLSFNSVISSSGAAYGLKIGTVTSSSLTGYGLYIDTVTGGTPYSVYVNATAPSYFAGKVGIGTTSPTAPLHVYGTQSPLFVASASFAGAGFAVNSPSTNVTSAMGIPIYIKNLSATPGNFAAITAADANSNLQGSIGMMFGAHTAAFQGTFYIEPRNVVTPSAFVVAPTGYVGVGTTTPAASLDVNGNSIIGRVSAAAATGSSILYSDSGTGYMAFQQRGSTTLGNMSMPVGASELLSTAGALGIYTYGAAGSYLAFGTATGAGTAEHMRIDTAGNVGIGTTSPGTTLSVNGNELVAGRIGAMSDASLGFNFGVNQTGIFMQNYTTYGRIQAFNYNGGGSALPIVLNDSGGYVGIGSTAPRASLDLSAQTDAVLLPRSASASASIATPVAGMIRYNTTSAMFEGYSGTTLAWNQLGNSSATAGSASLLGSGLSALSPYSASATNTGLYSATATSMSVAVGGVEKFNVTSTGITNGAAATALYNTAFGASTLPSATGVGNTAFGYQAGLGNTTGLANTAVGYQSMLVNSTGTGNTAIGYLGLPANTTGSLNAAVGLGSLQANTTGMNNSAFGTGALRVNSSGSNNTVVGFSVGSKTLTTGSNNILIGTSASVDTPTAATSNYLNIGNTIYGNTASGYVGIGTTVPQSTLEVNGTMTVGSASENKGTTITWNDPSGYGDSVFTNMPQGAAANYGGFLFVQGTGSFFSTATNLMRIAGNGNVGIGSTAPRASLDLGAKTDALLLPQSASATASITTPVVGMIRYNTTTNGFEGYSGSSPTWGAIGGGTGALGLSTASISPYSASATNTGLFSATATSVSVAIKGIEVFSVTSSGITNGAAATALYNTAFGYMSLTKNTTGNNNAANGYMALYGNTTGNYNTANGGLALNHNTTGSGNTANGGLALNDNTTGSQNTANGWSTLNHNTTGNSNTANGVYALYNNETGSNNTANGIWALYMNSTGSYNTSNGYYALYYNMTGNYNTGMGAYALDNNADGYYNTAIGTYALYYATGTGGTALGYNAGKAITTGAQNVAIGYNVASTTLTTGSTNILIGTSASVDTVAAATSNAIAIGGRAGSYDTAVGVGALNAETADGLQNTAVGYQSLTSNTTGNLNTAGGSKSLYTNTIGSSNTAFGNQALYNNSTGNYNTAVGYGALLHNVTGQYNTAVGVAALNASLGYFNTANGVGALTNATGTGGTALGYQAGSKITTGAQNVAIGYNVGSTTLTTGSNNILIGTSASVDTPTAATSNYLNIGNTIYGNTASGSVGIGTTAPRVSLDLGAKTDALLLPQSASATASITTPVVGMIRYNTTTNGFEGYSGSSPTWGAIGGGTGALGLSTASISPYSASATNTGLFSATATSVSVAVGGVELFSVTSSGITNGAGATANLNAAFGPLALVSANGGAYNAALGYQALTKVYSGNYNTGMGAYALANNTAGYYNTAIGTYALYYATGTGGTALGYLAGKMISTGAQNVTIGYKVGSTTLTTGSNNILLGTSASTDTVAAASGNAIAIGGRAGTGDTSIGIGALNAETLDSAYNTVVGYQAMALSTTATANTAIGYLAMSSGAMTGTQNVSVGYGSLYKDTTGSNNATLGANAMLNNTGGSKNIAIGTSALYVNTTGASNVAIGYSVASTTLTTGSNNILIGVSASTDTATAATSNAIAIGGRAGTYDTAVGVGTLNAETTDSLINTAVGYNALTADTTGSVNNAFGGFALKANTTGVHNVALGYGALYTSSTGSYNTAVGNFALKLATTGSNNLAVGYNVGSVTLATGSTNILIGTSASTDTVAAASSNAIAIGGRAGTGDTSVGVGALNAETADSLYNTAIGYNALTANKTGTQSTGVGAYALKANTTGAQNVGVGGNALASNTTGIDNVAVGYYAAFTNTTASYNTAIGHQALGLNSVGQYNTAVGQNSLGSATGTSGSALGYYAGFSITTGANNSVFGYRVGSVTLTTGSNNILIGTSASVDTVSATTTNAIAIGGRAGTADTAVGVGTLNAETSNGLGSSAFGYQALYSNTTGSSNTALGSSALTYLVTGDKNTASGAFALSNNATGSYNTANGNNALGFATGNGGTAVGYYAGYRITTGAQNVAIGYNVGSTTLMTGATNILIGTSASTDTATAATTGAIAIGGRAGTYDTAVGVGALNAVTADGLKNTAIGYGAMAQTSTGGYNVAVGYQAMQVNSSGTNNTAVGTSALMTNSTGVSNNAFGSFAGAWITTGSQNNSFGTRSMNNTSTGTGNSAFGHESLYLNTTGSNNSAFGNNALRQTGTATTDNTGVGVYTLYSAVGGYNTSLGSWAGYSITTGANNLVLGYHVGMTTLTTGSNNILIGTSASVDVPAAATSNFLNIGNTIYGNLSAGYVGIGTTVPTYPLEIYKSGDNAAVRLKSNVNASVLLANTATSGHEYQIYSDGSGNLNMWDTNAGSNRLQISATGFVGIGLSSPSYPFQVGTTSANGAGAYLTAAGVWTNASDRRIKENIQPISYGLDTLMKLKPVSYDMKITHDKQVGFIAQDVAEVVPEVVSVSAEGNYGLSYGNLLSVAVKAIQELKAQNDELRQTVATLQAKADGAAPVVAASPVKVEPVSVAAGDDRLVIYVLAGAVGLLFVGFAGLGIVVFRMRRRGA